jgi:hypothetical protein
MGSGHFPLKPTIVSHIPRIYKFMVMVGINFLPLMKTYASKLECYNVRYDEHDTLVWDKNVLFGGLGGKNSECVG